MSNPESPVLQPVVTAKTDQASVDTALRCPVALPGGPTLRFQPKGNVPLDAFCQPVVGPTSLMTAPGERVLQAVLRTADLVTSGLSGDSPDGTGQQMNVKRGPVALGLAVREGLTLAAAKGFGGGGSRSVADIMAAIREAGKNVKASPADMGRQVDDLLAIAKKGGDEASEAIKALGTMIETREGAYFSAANHLLELSKAKKTAELALSEMQRLLKLPLGETAKSWDKLSPFQARQNLIDAAYKHPTHAKELLEAAKQCPDETVVVEATRKLELLGYK